MASPCACPSGRERAVRWPARRAGCASCCARRSSPPCARRPAAPTSASASPGAPPPSCSWATAARGAAATARWARRVPCLPTRSEPDRVADAAARLGLRYVVLTAVARDDLDDGGAAHFAATVRAVRARLEHARIEVLTPDFKGDEASLRVVLAAAPDVFNHNIEMAARLFPELRPQGDYGRSLDLLAAVEAVAAGAGHEERPHGGSGRERRRGAGRPRRPAREGRRHRHRGAVSATHPRARARGAATCLPRAFATTSRPRGPWAFPPSTPASSSGPRSTPGRSPRSTG